MSLRLLIADWHLSPALLVVSGLYGAAYVWAAAHAGPRWPLRRTFAFLAGLGCIVVALQSGIDTYDDRLLSVHMVQHMILLMIAPLLLLGGQPVLLIVRSLPDARRRRGVVRMLRRLDRLTGPIQCLTVFSLVVLLTHLPVFYNATLRDPALHDAEHVLYLCAGLLLWWPLLDADPAASRRLGGLGRLIYMLGAMPAMTVVGAFLNRRVTLVYPAYGHVAHIATAGAIADQAQAGAIMWVAGTMIVTAVGLWTVVAALVAEERRARQREDRLLGTGGLA